MIIYGHFVNGTLMTITNNGKKYFDNKTKGMNYSQIWDHNNQDGLWYT
jgi:hypothetical protein